MQETGGRGLSSMKDRNVFSVTDGSGLDRVPARQEDEVREWPRVCVPGYHQQRAVWEFLQNGPLALQT